MGNSRHVPVGGTRSSPEHATIVNSRTCADLPSPRQELALRLHGNEQRRQHPTPPLCVPTRGILDYSDYRDMEDGGADSSVMQRDQQAISLAEVRPKLRKVTGGDRFADLISSYEPERTFSANDTEFWVEMRQWLEQYHGSHAQHAGALKKRMQVAERRAGKESHELYREMHRVREHVNERVHYQAGQLPRSNSATELSRKKPRLAGGGQRDTLAKDDPLPDRVMHVIASATRPLNALEISKAVGGRTAKDANPTLYALEKEGKVKREARHPGKPHWSVS